MGETALEEIKDKVAALKRVANEAIQKYEAFLLEVNDVSKLKTERERFVDTTNFLKAIMAEIGVLRSHGDVIGNVAEAGSNKEVRMVNSLDVSTTKIISFIEGLRDVVGLKVEGIGEQVEKIRDSAGLEKE